MRWDNVRDVGDESRGKEHFARIAVKIIRLESSAADRVGDNHGGATIGPVGNGAFTHGVDCDRADGNLIFG